MASRRCGTVLLAACLLLAGLPSPAGATPSLVGYVDTPNADAIRIVVDETRNVLYTINQAGSAYHVASYDAASGAQLAVYGVGTNPTALAIDEQANRLYVVNNGSGSFGTLSIVDIATGVQSTMQLGYRPTAIALDRARNRLLVTESADSLTYPGSVWVIDASTYAVVAEYTGPLNPVALALDAGTGRLYVADSAYHNLWDLRAEDGGDPKSIALDGGFTTPRSVAVNPATRRVYVAQPNGTNAEQESKVSIIQGPDDFHYTPVSPSPGVVVSMAINHTSNRIYLVGKGELRTVSDSTVISRIEVDPYSFAKQVALNRRTNRLYVPVPGRIAIFTEYIHTIIDSGPSGLTNATSPTFGFHATVTTGVSFGCSMDGGGYDLCTSPMSYSGLPDGAHTFCARARESNGEVDADPPCRSFTVDTSIPETAIAAHPPEFSASDAVTFEFTGTDVQPVDTFECSMDGAFAPCVSPASFAGLAEGFHTFRVRALDHAGNIDPTPAAQSFTVDRVSPDAAISSGPQGHVGSTNAMFEFLSNEEGTTFACALDGPAAVCTTPRSYVGLPEGPHTFTVSATDRAGNVGPAAARSFTVDITPPVVSIVDGPAGVVNTRDAAVTFDASEPSTFRCRLDDAEYAECSSPQTFIDLSEGRHTFSALGSDRAGNVSTAPAVRSWTTDTRSPETTIVEAPSGFVASTSAAFRFEASEEAVFQCSLDEAAFEACDAAPEFEGLAAGPHVLAVRAVDPQDNEDETPATARWSIDTTRPLVEITRPGRGEIYVEDALVAPSGGPFTVAFGSLELRVRATDDQSDVTRVRFVVDGIEQPGDATKDPSTGEWTDTYTPPPLSSQLPGPHLVSARAVNGAGGVREASTTVYFVPNNA